MVSVLLKSISTYICCTALGHSPLQIHRLCVCESSHTHNRSEENGHGKRLMLPYNGEPHMTGTEGKQKPLQRNS